MIGKGDLKDGLYILNDFTTSNVMQKQICVTSSPKISIDLWHSRLAHPSLTHLHHLKDVLYFDSYSLKYDKPCYMCPLAKERCLTSHSNNHASAHPFDLIYANIWGLFAIPSYTGYTYFLAIIDDCTRYTWTYMFFFKGNVSLLLLLIIKQKDYTMSIKT